MGCLAVWDSVASRKMIYMTPPMKPKAVWSEELCKKRIQQAIDNKQDMQSFFAQAWSWAGDQDDCKWAMDCVDRLCLIWAKDYPNAKWQDDDYKVGSKSREDIEKAAKIFAGPGATVITDTITTKYTNDGYKVTARIEPTIKPEPELFW